MEGITLRNSIIKVHNGLGMLMSDDAQHTWFFSFFIYYVLTDKLQHCTKYYVGSWCVSLIMLWVPYRIWPFLNWHLELWVITFFKRSWCRWLAVVYFFMQLFCLPFFISIRRSQPILINSLNFAISTNGKCNLFNPPLLNIFNELIKIQLINIEMKNKRLYISCTKRLGGDVWNSLSFLKSFIALLNFW